MKIWYNFNERKGLKKNFKMAVLGPIISVFVIFILLTLIGQQEGWEPVEAGSISHIMSVIIFVGFIAIAVVIALFGNRNMKLAENIFLGDIFGNIYVLNIRNSGFSDRTGINYKDIKCRRDIISLIIMAVKTINNVNLAQKSLEQMESFGFLYGIGVGEIDYSRYGYKIISVKKIISGKMYYYIIAETTQNKIKRVRFIEVPKKIEDIDSLIRKLRGHIAKPNLKHI